MEFAAKVDWWFHAIMLGAALLMLVLIVASPKVRSGPLYQKVLLVVLSAAFIGGTLTLANERYVVKDGVLSSTLPLLGGDFLRVSEIRAVTPTNDLTASRAASIDRLRIEWGQRWVMIAVEDKEGFLSALVAADAGLVRHDDGLIRSGMR